MPAKKQITVNINQQQLEKLKQFKAIKKLRGKSSYEDLRGKLEESTIVVYHGKRGLSLLVQNLTPEVEKRIKKVIGQVKERVIEIDDSGWGEPVGGVIIVGNDVGGDRYASEEIPVELFQGSRFKKGDYYINAVKAVNKILSDLKANQDVKIKICSGTIFSSVYKFLEKNKYNYEKVKIKGETQRLAEGEFNSYLEGLGCKRGYQQMKKWIEEDPKERRVYIKTGWKEFKSLE